MRTALALPVIHLVDERYIDIASIEVYQCAYCRQSVDPDELSFNDYFNTDELIQAIKDKSYEEKGAIPDTVDLNTLSDEKFEGAYCEGCEKVISRDNWWGDNYVYICPRNGCYCDSSHSALECCGGICHHAHDENGMDCHCTRGVRVDGTVPDSQDSSLEGTLIYYCYCYDDCEYHVCLLDHYTFTSVSDAIEHWADEHPEHWQPGESEEPPETILTTHVVVKSREGLEALLDCEMCASEFCCPIHDTHKIPHNSCALG